LTECGFASFFKVISFGKAANPHSKGGELSMPTYLVQVAIPTIYVIDAKSPKLALQKAAKRFQKEFNTPIEPEFQWAQLKGSANDAEWVILDGEELLL
jgi:hypothetical protein